MAGVAGVAAAVAAAPLRALHRASVLGVWSERAVVGRAGHDRDGHQGLLAGVERGCRSSNGGKLTVRIRHLWESAYYSDRYTGELTSRRARRRIALRR